MYKRKNRDRCKAQAQAKLARQEEKLAPIPWHEFGNSGPNSVQIIEIACVLQASGRAGQLTRQQKDKNASTGKHGRCKTIGYKC